MTSFMNAKPTRTMSNEIKVGDKVRVREDAPRMYLRTMSTKFLGAECGVFEIIDGNAAIASGRDYIAIPLKYLVKVEDEAKEPKYHKGDRVRVCSKEAERYGRVGTVIETYPSGCVDVDFGDGCVGGHYYGAQFLEPYTEPTEVISQEEMESELAPAEHQVMPSIAYWDAYTADLAKEIAVKSMEKSYGCDPERIADYAVSVAKAVAEGLKRK